jgi:hypothetical protein
MSFRPLIAAAIAGLLCNVASVASVAAAEDVTADFLAGECGLVRLAEKWWLLPAEMELKERLAALPARRERIIAAEKDLDAAIERNLQAWQQARPQIASLKTAQAKLSSADPKRAALARQIEALESSAVDPKRLGGQAEARALAVALASERCALAADAAWIRGGAAAMHERYARLSDDPRVREALSKLGASQRLGPQRNYQGDLQRLGEYERLAATAWTPIHLQAGVTRVTALVNEATAATFSWNTSLTEGAVLTSGTAENLGVIPPDAAPRKTITLPGGRKAAARQATIDYLRLGQCLVRGVPAWVLSPEAEDAGNWLGSAALAEHQARLEPERLRMWIDR